MPSKKLNSKQSGQLGGFARAKALGPDELSRIGIERGYTTFERYGREHYVRIAHKRWGRLSGAETQPKPRQTRVGARAPVPDTLAMSRNVDPYIAIAEALQATAEARRRHHHRVFRVHRMVTFVLQDTAS